LALVRRSASALLDDARTGRLGQLLVEQARAQLRSGTGVAEVRSWDRSLPVLLDDLVEAGLGGVEVLVEHKLPYTPKRADLVLCGVHPRTGDASYVVVELKQWSHATADGSDRCVVPGWSEPVLHPVEQVRRYCQHLVDFTPALAERPGLVSGAAYLHNALDPASVWSLRTYRADEFGRLFMADRRSEWLDFLRARLVGTDRPGIADLARRAADDLLHARVGPSRPLLEVAAREVREREQYVLLDEQQVAFGLVRDAVARAGTRTAKEVVVVSGGPGSGKSVIALSLLGELSRQGHRVLHATGSSAFTSTMRSVAGARAPRVRGMFVYFNSFMDTAPHALDVLICDEAHRIRETSVNRYTRAALRSQARPQVDELIDAARVPVFLLDEHQVVRPGELGSLAEFRAASESKGCVVHEVHLEGQYRCGGSVLFDTWVHRLLGLVPGAAPVRWSDLARGSDDQYVVRVAESPADLEAWLLDRAAPSSETARISAGYCWPWSDPIGSGAERHLRDDVVIGDWRRPWNAKPGGKRVPDAPESYYWASDPRGFRPGRLHLHGTGLRVRLVGGDPRAGPRAPGRNVDRPAWRVPGSSRATCRPRGVRGADPEHVQGAPDPGDARGDGVQHRCRDAGMAAGAGLRSVGHSEARWPWWPPGLAAVLSWRWRESNPRPPSARQGFSGRSPLCRYSAPPVLRTSRCDRPSHCAVSLSPPWPAREVILLVDARVRAGGTLGLTEPRLA